MQYQRMNYKKKSSVFDSKQFREISFLIQEIAREENNTAEETRLRKKLEELEQRASELDRKRTENISIIS